MKNTICIFSCCLYLWCTGCQSADSNQVDDFSPIRTDYPEAQRDTSFTRSYAGYRVTDPYHWLEQADAAQSWVSGQAAAAQTYLGQLPGRQILQRQLTELQNYVEFSAPRFLNGALYYFKTEKGRLLGLYRRESLNSEEEQLFGPAAQGWPAFAQVIDISPSPNRELLAMEVSMPDSEWADILVYDLKNEVFLQDTVSFVRHSTINWHREGFFYSRYPPPDGKRGPYLFQQVYYHRVGTPQSSDELIYADRSEPRSRFHTFVSADGAHLIVRASSESGGQAILARPLTSPDAAFAPIVEEPEHQWDWAGSDSRGIYLITSLDAPNRRLVRIDPSRPSPVNWATILPEGQSPLESVSWIDGKILAVYRGQQGSAMALYDSKGQLLKRPKLPNHGRILDVRSQPDKESAFIKYGQFLEPPQIYHLDLAQEKMTAFHSPVTTFDPAKYEVRQVTFKSYDNSEVSMYLIHQKDNKPRGNVPVLLFAGGAASGPFAPMYRTEERLLAQLMLQQGGACAIPALRGGGALKSTRRRSGQREYKQNTFDDFQAAAEYLIINEYTAARKISVYGQGNGALVACAGLAQRPDLFGAIACSDGLYDLLRYPESGTDWIWLPEFGAPEDPQMFDHIFAYSPVHKLPADNYPATFLLAHPGGDKIQPFHTWKMGAALQFHQQGVAPVLVKPTPQTRTYSETGADIMAFLLYNTQTPVQE